MKAKMTELAIVLTPNNDDDPDVLTLWFKFAVGVAEDVGEEVELEVAVTLVVVLELLDIVPFVDVPFVIAWLVPFPVVVAFVVFANIEKTTVPNSM